MSYTFIKNQPVAKFYYKGTHSHPVKRTVLITEQNKDTFKGLEVRDGNAIRSIDDAPIKTFCKERIATTSQLRTNSAMYSKKDECTLERMSWTQAEKVGF